MHINVDKSLRGRGLGCILTYVYKVGGDIQQQHIRSDIDIFISP